ncbi:unnamed protein product, partial [Rotaria socialis]
QLYQRDRQQQGQSNGKRVVVVEDEDRIHRTSPPSNRHVVRAYVDPADDEMFVTNRFIINIYFE